MGFWLWLCLSLILFLFLCFVMMMMAIWPEWPLNELEVMATVMTMVAAMRMNRMIVLDMVLKMVLMVTEISFSI